NAIDRPLSDVFVEFDQTPAACASLAQVYFGRLRENGAYVAVKVQKPDLQSRMETDFQLGRWLASLLQQRVSALQSMDLVSVIDEAHTAMMRELDFRHEARNQEYFNTLNSHPDRVFAPKVYAQFSSERVLVMEKIAGIPVSQAAGAPREVRQRLAG